MGEVKKIDWDRSSDNPVTPKTYEGHETITNRLNSQERQASPPGSKQKQPATKVLVRGCPTEHLQVLVV